MLRINKKRCLKYTVKLKGNQGREPKIGVIYLVFFLQSGGRGNGDYRFKMISQTTQWWRCKDETASSMPIPS